MTALDADIEVSGVTGDVFVTGTDTGVGKTLLSALLVAARHRNYWKPIQTGACEGTDRESVLRWAGLGTDRAHPEAVLLDEPVSPHLAAEHAQLTIDLQAIRRPADPAPLVIEGAGGVLVPVNGDSLMIDLMKHLGAPAIVAARTALGTINHTLLTLSALRHARVPVLGVVMIGKENADNKSAIERYGEIPVIGFIPWLDEIEAAVLRGVFERHFDRGVFL